MPTLVIDGAPMTESAALLMVLAERHPAAGLAPAPGSAERQAWYRWIVYLSNTLAATYRFWFYPTRSRRVRASASRTRSAAAKDRRRMGSRGHRNWPAAGPYLLGREFSGADLYLTMLMRWSRKMPRPATEWPALKALADRVRERPSWKKLYELEGLTEW